MLKQRFTHSLVAVVVLLSMLVQGTWVLAGTTGGLTGVVTQTDTGAPIAGAKVTVTSPSQSATTTTDNGGHFTFISLAPDTYTLSVEKSGYDPAALAGVNVLADQSQSVAITTRPTLRTIGRVTARSATDLVKPGTTSDVYSVSSAQQTAVQGLGGGGSLNQAYSAIASVPGVYVPQGQNGIYQSAYVRGGNYTQLGYEFDGVPIQRAFDQYPSTALSSLGQQELQVYTGAAPADAQSSGLAGFVNQVIKTGTYPGFANLNLSLGTPTFYHKAQFEFGGATANRLFSYYVGLAGYDQSFRFGSQFNGAQYDSTFGTPYNILAASCTNKNGTANRNATAGCYPNAAGPFGIFPVGPNGFAMGPFIYNFNDENLNRESVINLHVGIPHHKDGGKDDIQLLYDNSWLLSPYEVSYNAWGPVASAVASGSAIYNGVTYPTCASAGAPPCGIVGPVGFSYVDTTVYNGAMGVPLTSGLTRSVANYYEPNSPLSRQPGALIDPSNRDSYNNRASIEKVQYQKNMGSNAFFRVYGYSFYSDWLQNGPESLNQNFTGGVSADYELITHTRGVVGSFVDQLNSQNLLNLTGGYTYASTVRWNNGWNGANPNVAVLVGANQPLNGLCYAPTTDSHGNVQRGAMTPTYCGSGVTASYQLPGASGGPLSLAPNYPVIPASTSNPGSPGVTLNNLSSFSCGGGPCEFYTVQNGMSGAYNTVAPRFWNYSLEDTYKPNEKTSLNAGVVFDDFRYDLSDTTVPAGPEPQAVSAAPRILWQNSYNLFHCVQKGAVVTVTTPTTTPGACPSGFAPANVSVVSPGSNDYHTISPRLGATYSLNPLNVFRASWGKYEQPASSAFQQYNNAGYNLPNSGTNRAFYPLGFFNPTHQVYPETSFNFDFSWEHQQKNSDISWKLTPFLRKTQNELYMVLLDPKTSFVSSINVGSLTASGLEFLLRKGDFARNGFSGQLAYTYTYGSVKFGTLSTGGTVLDGVNQAIVQYNSYTSYCAGHAKSPMCSILGQPILPTNNMTAAPCYISGGAGNPAKPSPCTAPNAYANPYWNAPPQPLFDASQSYIAYNQLPGVNLASTPVSSSYIIPHVAALLLNYKKDKFAITPALQFTAGGRYGSPVEGGGIDPAGGCTPLAAGSVTGDPRYPYGGPASGRPYNAASCIGSIVTPNFQSGKFDNFGAFVEPSELALSTQITYQASQKVTLRLTAANLYVNCFGGSNQAWTRGIPYAGSSNCWYGTPAAYVGNFYNPGNQIQPLVAGAYSPVFGQTFQSAYSGQANPFQLYLTAEMRL